MKDILVAGSNGFLGRTLMPAVAACGIRGHAYDLTEGNDIFDAANLKRKLQGMDGCVLLAAQANLEQAEQDPTSAFRLNVDGAILVAEACAETQTKLLFTSSVCVYGNNQDRTQTEDSPISPTEIYAETKVEAERQLRGINGLDYRVIRPSVFYGPGMRPALAAYKFMYACLTGEAIQVHGDGKQTRSYVHVEDVASAFIAVLQAWPQETEFNVASDELVSVLDLVEIISSITNAQPEIRHVSDRSGQIYHSHIDSSRLKSYGWQPKYPSLRAGLETCLSEVSAHAR